MVASCLGIGLIGLFLQLPVSLGFLNPPEPARQTISAELLAREAEHALRLWQVPGVAVVMVHGGQVQHATAFGLAQLEPPEPMTVDQVVPLASCTKAFTAALVWQQIHQGHWSLDTPVRRIWPAWDPTDPTTRDGLQIRHLLGHTNSLAAHEYLWFQAPWNLSDSLTRWQQTPRQQLPGAAYDYASLNYVLLGRLLEIQTRRSWAQQIQSELAGPLKLNGWLDRLPPPGRQVPTGYDWDVTRKRLAPKRVQPLAEANPAGSLALPAREIAAWMQFWLTPPPAWSFLNQALQPLSVLPRQDPAIAATYPDSETIEYASGWVRYDWLGETILGHGGIWEGYRTQILLIPRWNLGLALVANRHRTRMNLPLGHRLLAQALGRRPPRSLHWHYAALDLAESARKDQKESWWRQQRRPDRPPAFPLRHYLGRYQHPAYGRLEIVQPDPQGPLQARWSSFAWTLEPIAGEAFRMLGTTIDDNWLEFRTDPRQPGHPDALRWGSLIFSYLPVDS